MPVSRTNGDSGSVAGEIVDIDREAARWARNVLLEPGLREAFRPMVPDRLSRLKQLHDRLVASPEQHEAVKALVSEATLDLLFVYRESRPMSFRTSRLSAQRQAPRQG